MNSRLNLALRERRGMAYNVESGYTAYSDTGLFNVYFGTDKENLDKALALVQKEFDLLRNKKLGAVQLSSAKKQLIGQIVITSYSIHYTKLYDSGVLRYVVVKYAGSLVDPENELNGIAFQGVGNGTVVDYVQVHNNSDDGIECFGGTVNLKHVILTGNGDDS